MKKNFYQEFIREIQDFSDSDEKKLVLDFTRQLEKFSDSHRYALLWQPYFDAYQLVLNFLIQKSDAPFLLWDEIKEDMKRLSLFKNLYIPLKFAFNVQSLEKEAFISIILSLDILKKILRFSEKLWLKTAVYNGGFFLFKIVKGCRICACFICFF